MQLIPLESQFGLITIAEVRVAPDLSEARVYVHSEHQSSKLITKLSAMSGIFMREIATVFTQKRTPRLIFIIDIAAKSTRRIEELLAEDSQRNK